MPTSAHLLVPPIKGLAAFEAVARLGSFTRAADELALTPSAVSHRIAQLEGVVGAALLLRAGAAVGLTPQGEALLPHVRAGLEQLREGLARAAAAVDEARPKVRLSLAPAIASHWLVRRLAAFQRDYPGIDLEIQVTSRPVDLRAGEADLGIRFGDGRWPGLEAQPLLPVRLIAVCSPAYRRAHAGLAEPKDLARATLLRQALFPWRPWLAAAGLDWPEPRQGPAFSEVSLLIDAALCGQGVALVPDLLVQAALESGALVALFGLELPSERAYHLVLPLGQPVRPEVQALAEWLRRSV